MIKHTIIEEFLEVMVLERSISSNKLASTSSIESLERSQRMPKWPNGKPHGATRQQAIVKTPAKWSAYQIPSVIVVFVILVF
jgi:hypothetical protein